MPTKKGGKTSTELYGTVSETNQQSKARQRVTRQRAQKPNFGFECAAENPHDISTKSSKSAQYSQEQHKGESNTTQKQQSVHFRANRNTTKPKSEQMAQKVARAHHGMRGKHGVRVLGSFLHRVQQRENKTKQNLAISAPKSTIEAESYMLRTSSIFRCAYLINFSLIFWFVLTCSPLASVRQNIPPSSPSRVQALSRRLRCLAQTLR